MHPAVAVAFALALAVAFVFVFALAVAFVFVLAFLSVIPEGNLLLVRTTQKTGARSLP